MHTTVQPMSLAFRNALPPPPTYAERKVALKASGDPLNVARAEMRKLANELFVRAQKPYHINARKSLAALFDGIYPHATTWNELCLSFDPDPLPWLPDFELLPKGYRKELLAIFADEVQALRAWGQVLLSWTANNQSVIDTADEQQLEQITALTAAVEANALPEGYVLPHAERLRDRARYNVLTTYGMVYDKVRFDKPRHTFTYTLPNGEFGALPLSHVSHIRPLDQ